MIKIRKFYRQAGRWYDFPFWQEYQQYNPYFRWEISLFCWGIIIY